MMLLIYVAIAVLVAVGIYHQVQAHKALRQSVRALGGSYDRLFRHVDAAIARLEAKTPDEQRGWQRLTVKMHEEVLTTPETALVMLPERLIGIVIRDTLAMKNLERAIAHIKHTSYSSSRIWLEREDDPFSEEASPFTSSSVKKALSKSYAT